MQVVDRFLRHWMGVLFPEYTEEDPQGGLARLFVFLLLLTCAVYARALFFPVLGIDTFTYAISHGYGDIYFEIIRGTWGLAAIDQLVPGPLVAPVVSMLFFLLATSSSAFLVTVFWMGRVPDWRSYSVGAIMALFPYWASQAYYGFYHYGYALTVLGGILSVLLPWQRGGWRRYAASVGFFVLGAGMYQGSVTTSSGLIGATLLVGFVSQWLGRPYARYTLRSLVRVACTLLAGGIGYLLVHKLVLVLTRMPDLSQGVYTVKMTFSPLRLLDMIPLMLPSSPLLLPLPATVLLFVPLVLLCVTFAGRLLRHQVAIQDIRRLFSGLIPLLLLALLAPSGLMLIQTGPLAPRSMCGVAFVAGAIFLISALLLEGRWRKTFLAVTVALCLLFTGSINYAWHVQALTTEADLTDARLMQQRMSDLPEYAQSSRPLDVAFVGCLSDDVRNWPHDMESMFGISQFSCFVGENNLQAHASAPLRFVGPQIKSVPTEKMDREAVAGRKPWPAPESVFWNGDHFVIWLGPMHRQQVTMDKRLQLVSEAFGVTTPTMPLPSRKLLDIAKEGDKLKPRPGYMLQPVLGQVDGTAPIPGNTAYVRVHGWAFDLPAKQVPQYVGLLNCDGSMVGLAASGIHRPDLVRRVAADAEYAGFDGFALANEKICGVGY